MQIDPYKVLNFLLSSSPQIQNNPNAKRMIDVIQSGDSIQGAQIADNLCKTYGVTREQATQQAQSWVYGLMRR